MTSQEAALVTVADRLERFRVPYTIIGGMANAIWGEPRATLDIDVAVWVDEGEITSLLARLADDYKILAKDAVDFIHQTRVLPLESEGGIRIDMIFGMLPFEQAAIERSVIRHVSNKPVRFCSAEDLILYKIVSDRPQDLNDVRAIVGRSGNALDRNYLDPRIQELSETLERSEIWANYESWIGEDS